VPEVQAAYLQNYIYSSRSSETKMVREFTNIQQASSAAVAYIVDLAGSAVRDKGFFTLVLAGGSTPRQTYELLSAAANAEQMPWQQSHFFWGDERWLPANHPESNFCMADKALLSRVPIPAHNIHRITTGHKNPETGAELYERHLRDFFHLQGRAGMKSNVKDMAIPSFDLVLLGMGTDGHTASLFPGSSLLEEKKKWVAAVPEGVGSPPVARITLTLPLLNGAENVIFLTSGSRKRAILDTILTRPEEAVELYPAARIKPAGNLVWLASAEG
jgi:6-phosphogluconolactonase